MDCDEFRDMIEPYLEEALASSQRDAFRQHLRSCRQCRERAVAVDPTLVFATIDPPDPRPERVEAAAQAVVAQIRQQRIARRLRSSRKRWLAAAAAVLVVIGIAAVWRLTGPAEEPSVPGLAEVAETSTDVPPPPRVEVDMSDEGVRVYQFADEGDPDTAVYYIVNPALES